MQTITIHSDFICPWCWLGLARMERVTRDFEVQLDWRPFLLRPDMPEGGMPLSEMLPPEYLAQGEARLQAACADAGVPYAPPHHVPNTRLAHEAAHEARLAGFGDAYHRAVLKARFADARDVGDPAVLAAIATEIGLDAARVEAALADRRHQPTVEAELEAAYAAGVQGVPHFDFGPGMHFSGAQPDGIFTQILEALGVPRK